MAAKPIPSTGSKPSKGTWFVTNHGDGSFEGTDLNSGD